MPWIWRFLPWIGFQRIGCRIIRVVLWRNKDGWATVAFSIALPCRIDPNGPAIVSKAKNEAPRRSH